MRKTFIPLSDNQVLVTDPSVKDWEGDVISAFQYLLPGIKAPVTVGDTVKDHEADCAIFYNLYGFAYTKELVANLKEATKYPVIDFSNLTTTEREAQVRGTALALQRGLVPTSELSYFIGTNTNYRSDMYILYNKTVDWAYVPFTHVTRWVGNIVLNGKEVSKWAKQEHVTHDSIRYYKDSRAFLDCLLLSKAVKICSRDFDLQSSLSDLLPNFHKLVNYQGIEKINVKDFGTQEDLVDANNPAGDLNTTPIFALYYRSELFQDTFKPTQIAGKLLGFKPTPNLRYRGEPVDLRTISMEEQVKRGFQLYKKQDRW